MRAFRGVAFLITLQIVFGLSLTVSRPGALQLGIARRTVPAGAGISRVSRQHFSMADPPGSPALPVLRTQARVGFIRPEELSEVATQYQSDHGDGGAHNIAKISHGVWAGMSLVANVMGKSRDTVD